jgi:hypothetical protein
VDGLLVRSGRSNGPFDRTKQLGLVQPSRWRMVGQGGVWPLAKAAQRSCEVA